MAALWPTWAVALYRMLSHALGFCGSSSSVPLFRKRLVSNIRFCQDTVEPERITHEQRMSAAFTVRLEETTLGALDQRPTHWV